MIERLKLSRSLDEPLSAFWIRSSAFSTLPPAASACASFISCSIRSLPALEAVLAAEPSLEVETENWACTSEAIHSFAASSQRGVPSEKDSLSSSGTRLINIPVSKCSACCRAAYGPPRFLQARAEILCSPKQKWFAPEAKADSALSRPT